MKDLIELEQQGWQALSTDAEAARTFYASLLREDAVMVFPGGLRLEGRDRILQSIAAQPWRSFHIEEPQVISLSSNAATLVYRVSAQREGSDPYVALISSTYVRDGEWRLVFHQHTPL